MSQYRIGTADVTNASATVLGNATEWLANIAINDWFIVNSVIYIVGGIVSDTELSLTAPYGGATESGVAYVLHRDFGPDGQPLIQDGDIETATIFNSWAAAIAPFISLVVSNGTWTPVISDEASGGNLGSATIVQASWSRINNLVTVTGSITNIDTSGLTAGNILFIQGAPFAADGFSWGALSTAVINTVPTAITITSDYFTLERSSIGSLSTTLVVELSSGAADIHFTMTYIAA